MKFVMPTEAEIDAEFKRMEDAGLKPFGRSDAKHALISKRMRDGVRKCRAMFKAGKAAEAGFELCDFMLTSMDAIEADRG